MRAASATVAVLSICCVAGVASCAGGDAAAPRAQPVQPDGSTGQLPTWSGAISIRNESFSEVCRQVMPDAAAAPVVAAVDLRAGEACHQTTSDGDGYVFTRCWSAGLPKPTRWIVLGPDGSFITTFNSYGTFWPAPHGILGFESRITTVPPPDQVVHVAADGKKFEGLWLDNDEHPGVVNRRFGAGLVAAGLPAASANAFAVTRYDAGGAAESLVNVAPPCPYPIAVAEDRSGLVAYVAGTAGSPLCLTFIDPSSAGVSPKMLFDAPSGTRLLPYGGWIELFGLAGGGVAIFANGVPIGVANPMTNSIDAAPQWLRDHPGEAFRVVRHGEAQALAKADAGTAIITVVSATGEVCGTISVTDFAFGDIGFDGTLVGSTGTENSIEIWWPGLLR